MSRLSAHRPAHLSRPTHGLIRRAGLSILIAAFVATGGCASDDSSSSAEATPVVAGSKPPGAIKKLLKAITGKPVENNKPLTRAEGIKLLEKIRKDPAKLQTLSTRERLFLAKAAYAMEEDDF